MSNRSRRARKFAALGGGALVATPFIGGGVAEAGTFTVTTLADSGDGSLRDAIERADTAGGADTINFQVGLTGSIVLTSALEINSSMTIVGPGVDLVTIDGDDNDRIFYIHDSSNIDVTVSGLTVTGGLTGKANGGAIFASDVDLVLDGIHVEDSSAGNGYGGGVYIEGDGANGSSLQILNSEITGNSAFYGGGVYVEDASGPVVVRDTLISGNSATNWGGGLYFDDGVSLELTRVVVSDNTAHAAAGAAIGVKDDVTVTIADSTFVGNSAPTLAGGAIGFENPTGDITIVRSTFSGNTSGNVGGALYFVTVFGDVSIVDCTVSGNTARMGGGVYVHRLYDSGGSFSIAHSTITGNTATTDDIDRSGGGGVYLYNAGVSDAGAITLDHIVVAGNTAADSGEGGKDVGAGGGGFDASWSMIGDLDGTTVNGTNMLAEGDPKLGPLADNGGETETHLPLAGSPLLDAGDPAFVAPPATDQRGLDRVGNGRIDVGAVEVTPERVLPPTGSTNEVVAWFGAAMLALGGAMHLGGRRTRRS